MAELSKQAFKLQGHLQFQGMGIAVENKPGSVRKGVGKDGKPWRVEMKHPYGYIQGTTGADGEEVDAFVGPDRKAENAFVVHQHKEDGKGYDEDKVMLGFRSREEATKAFLDNYSDKKFLGPISTIPMPRFREIIEGGGVLKKISAKNEQGWWRGDPMSPEGVKFKTKFQGIPIHVDRPKGFIMTGKDDKGESWERKYKYDYGFIPKTEGGDGDGLDVFVGPNKSAGEAYWAIQRKKDGSFDEYKIFLGFNSKAEATTVYKDHIPKKFLAGMVTLRLDMMKAMLGLDGGLTKAAELVSFLDEIDRIQGDSQ